MHRFSVLVAAILSCIIVPAARAEPRGRSQANAASAPSAPSPDDGDGPEAKAAALFKLDDIIEVAVRLSPDIARARSDRDIAQASAGAARREQAWILSASASYERDAVGADTPDNRLTPLQVLADDKITASLGLGRKLPTGGSVSVELGLTHDRQELNVPGEFLAQAAMQQSECGENVDIFCQDQAIARLSLKQPLLRGLGGDVALASERKADLSAAEATLHAQLAAEDMLREVISSYWELAYAAQEVDIRTESLELAKKQDQLTRQEMRAGTAAQNALDAVSYEIATREGALLGAKLTFEQKSLDLRRKAGLEIGRRDIVVRPKDPLELDTRDWNVEDVIAASHRINRRLATILLEQKLADVDVDVAHDQTLPQIDLSLSGALTGTGDTGSGAFSGVSGGDGFGYQVTAGLTMSFEISGAAKAGHSAALARRHRLDIERVDLERKIDAEIVSAVKALMSGRTRVALADKAIGFAEDNVRAERASFLAQRSTNFQVMQRQVQLADARLSRARAVADHQIAVAQLQFLSGTLLEAYRIRVRPRGDSDARDAGKARDTRSTRSATSHVSPG
jgi:outer membrane protein TolC